MKSFYGEYDAENRIRAALRRCGEQVPQAIGEVGERCLARRCGTDGSDIEFVVQSVVVGTADARGRGFAIYTPVPGSARVITGTGGYDPESSDEQLARDAGADLGRTGELPGA